MMWLGLACDSCWLRVKLRHLTQAYHKPCRFSLQTRNVDEQNSFDLETETASDSDPTNREPQITSHTAPSFPCQITRLDSACDSFTSQAAPSDTGFTWPRYIAPILTICISKLHPVPHWLIEYKHKYYIYKFSFIKINGYIF